MRIDLARARKRLIRQMNKTLGKDTNKMTKEEMNGLIAAVGVVSALLDGIDKDFFLLRVNDAASKLGKPITTEDMARLMDMANKKFDEIMAEAEEEMKKDDAKSSIKQIGDTFHIYRPKNTRATEVVFKMTGDGPALNLCVHWEEDHANDI